MGFKVLAATWALGAASLVAGDANALTQIADGGFEAQAATVGSYCYFGFATPGGPACPTGAWTGTSGMQDETNSAWPGAPTPDGAKYGFVQIASNLQQTFTANDTGFFTLGWLDAGRPPGVANGNQTYDVLLNTLLLGSYSTVTGQGFAARTTGPFALLAGQSYTLTFQGTTTYNGDVSTDNTSFIDAVQLTAVAVPEPGTWTLMIAGFGAAGAMLRRRRAFA